MCVCEGEMGGVKRDSDERKRKRIRGGLFFYTCCPTHLPSS